MKSNRWVTSAVCGLVLLLSAVHAAGAVHTVEAEDVTALLKGGEDEVFLLDVRTPGEFRRGRIPGAVLIPMNQIPRSLEEVPRDRKVVVVCTSGARSRAVARYLDEKGYPWVANYAGGVADWYRRGLPLER